MADLELKKQFARVARLRTLSFGEFMDEMGKAYIQLDSHRNDETVKHKDPYRCQICSSLIGDHHERLVYWQKTKAHLIDDSLWKRRPRSKRQRR